MRSRRVLALIPILGGLVWFAAVVFGLGALLVASLAGPDHQPRRSSSRLTGPVSAVSHSQARGRR